MARSWSFCTIGIGHDLGDGRYVLRRAPDLVVFGIATGGEHGFFRSAREMQQDPEFWRDYTLVDFEGAEPYVARARIWCRHEYQNSGKPCNNTTNGPDPAST